MGEDEVVIADAAEKTDEYTDAIPQEPPDGQVVFFNDDYTEADFVVQVLMEIFHKSAGEAMTLMIEANDNGQAIVGVYALDVAVTRARQAIKKARDAGFPLQVQVFTLFAGGADGKPNSGKSGGGQ